MCLAQEKNCALPKQIWWTHTGIFNRTPIFVMARSSNGEPYPSVLTRAQSWGPVRQRVGIGPPGAAQGIGTPGVAMIVYSRSEVASMAMPEVRDALVDQQVRLEEVAASLRATEGAQAHESRLLAHERERLQRAEGRAAQYKRELEQATDEARRRYFTEEQGMKDRSRELCLQKRQLDRNHHQQQHKHS